MRRLLVPLTTLAVLGVVTACGGGSSDDSSSGGDEGGNAALTVGVIPIVDVAPIYLGEEQGFFADHGIDLELTQLSGGAAALPAVVSGDLDFAFGNITSQLLAGSQGLPIRMVAEGNSSTGDPATDFGAIVVPADSPIQSVADLAGSTVAINNLNNINDVTTRKLVADAGGDPAAINFTELGFPDMPAALANGNVDAAQVVEPFLSVVKSQGARVLAANYAEATEDLTVATYFTTEQYLQENADVVDDFQAAIKESLQYAQDNPDEVRRIISTYTNITADQAAGIALPAFPQDVNVDSVQAIADLMSEYGIVEGDVDVDALLATD